MSQPDNSNQTSIALIPGLSGRQKLFIKNLRKYLIATIEEIESAEEDEDENEINFQLYSLFASFDEEYRDLHETGRNFTEINRENLLQAAQVSLSYSTFLGNVLVMTAQVLDSALKSRDYSHVLSEFDTQIMGLIH